MNNLRYSLIYWLGASRFFKPPRWDTGITPPEVERTVPGLNPGQALDIGCGTGTNSLYLAQLGWRVLGVDFVGKALRTARSRAGSAGLEDKVEFIRADITRLNPERLPVAQFALDIGCFHSLSDAGRRHYRLLVASSLEAGSLFMLYAHFPGSKRGIKFGMSIDTCTSFFAPAFRLENVENDQKSAWYWFQRLG